MWKLSNGSAGAYWDLTGDIAKVIFSEKGIGGYFLTTQFIENYKNLEGKMLTLSIKSRKITENAEGVVWLTARADEDLAGSKSFQLNDNEWHVFSITFTCPSEISESFRIYTNFSSWSDYEVEYLKLEVGEIATKFVDDDPATKLSKCQRYLESIVGVTVPSNIGGANVIFMPIPLKNKRAQPNVVQNVSELIGQLTEVRIGGVSTNYVGNVTDLTVYANTNQMCILKMTLDTDISGFGMRSYCNVRITGGIGMLFSAEL